MGITFDLSSGTRLFIKPSRNDHNSPQNDSEEIGLSIVQEIHLVVSLSRSVLTLVPKTELVSFHLLTRATRSLTMLFQMSTNSGFGGIHGAWETEAGVKRSNLRRTQRFCELASLHPGMDPLLNLRRQERLLLKAIVEYLGTTASEFTGELVDACLSACLILILLQSLRSHWCFLLWSRFLDVMSGRLVPPATNDAKHSYHLHKFYYMIAHPSSFSGALLAPMPSTAARVRHSLSLSPPLF
jgi:hypothetical protein